jgi:hypothetical protein
MAKRWRTDYDVVGNGHDALLLPALSSVWPREKMIPLACLLQARHRCIVPDWPGFGAARGPDARLTPEVLLGFLTGSLPRSCDTLRWSSPPLIAPPT